MRKDLRFLLGVLVAHGALAGVGGCSGQPLTVASDEGGLGAAGSGAGSGSGGTGSGSGGGAGSGLAQSGAGSGGSGMAMSGGAAGSGTVTSGGSGAATSGHGGSGSATSGGHGGSGSATSGTGGGSGSAASGSGGEIDAGGATTCTVTKGCAASEVCGFPRAPVCGTKGLCFPAAQIACLVYTPGCACDGTEINIDCNGLPAGYDTKPLRHAGVCKDGG